MSEQGLKDIRKDAPASHELTERERILLTRMGRVQNKRYSEIIYYLAYLEELLSLQAEEEPHPD